LLLLVHPDSLRLIFRFLFFFLIVKPIHDVLPLADNPASGSWEDPVHARVQASIRQTRGNAPDDGAAFVYFLFDGFRCVLLRWGFFPATNLIVHINPDWKESVTFAHGVGSFQTKNCFG
jgi:hypothetical protein